MSDPNCENYHEDYSKLQSFFSGNIGAKKSYCDMCVDRHIKAGEFANCLNCMDLNKDLLKEIKPQNKELKPPMNEGNLDSGKKETPVSDKLTIKDSGTRDTFSTGAVRDGQTGKGRMDLMPVRALLAISKIMEEGALKYEARNWEKGINLSRFVDSGLRHMMKWMRGDRDEPHLEQACWNFICLLDTQQRIAEGLLPDSLNDLPCNPIECVHRAGPAITPRPTHPYCYELGCGCKGTSCDRSESCLIYEHLYPNYDKKETSS